MAMFMFLRLFLFVLLFVLVDLSEVKAQEEKVCEVQDESSCKQAQQRGLHSLPVPSKLPEKALQYASIMVILDIMDERFAQDEEFVVEKERRVPIRGFNYTIHPGDSNSVKVTPRDGAGLNDVLAELAENGDLKKFMNIASSHLNVSYLSVTNVSFVGWFGDSPLDSVQNLFALEAQSSYYVIIPLVTVPATSLQVLSDNGEVKVVPVEKDAILISQHDVVQPVLMSDTFDPNLVVVLSVEPSNQKQSLPPSDWPITVDFMNSTLAPGDIEPVRWARSGVIPTVGAFRMGLDPKLSTSILSHTKKIGMVDTLERLLYDDPLPVADISREFRFGNHDWYIERPGEYKQFDMLFLIPKDEDSHNEFLKALSAAGFDEVISAMARRFDWDAAVCVHVSLLALTHGEGGAKHADYMDTGGNKAFNILIPLILVEGSPPELYVDSNDALRGPLKYQMHEGVMVGEDAYHATRPTDYRSEKREFRFFAGVYVADVNKDNADNVTPSYYKAGYPHHNEAISLRNAGKHWQRRDASVKLPTW